jgi:hypothetical protein
MKRFTPYIFCLIVLVSASLIPSAYAQTAPDPTYVAYDKPVDVPARFVPANSTAGVRSVTTPFAYVCIYMALEYIQESCSTRVNPNASPYAFSANASQPFAVETFWDNSGGPGGSLPTVGATDASMLVQVQGTQLQVSDYYFNSNQYFTCSSTAGTSQTSIQCGTSFFPQGQIGYLTTRFNPGSVGGYSTSITVQINASNSIDGSYDEIRLNLNVNEPPRNASITGRFLEDVLADGNEDPGDPGIPGIIVYLDSDSDEEIDDTDRTSTTDQNGSFLFDQMTGGPYRLMVSANQSAPYVPVTGEYAGTGTLGSDETLTRDFLYYRPIAFTGCTWVDMNGSGLQDEGEANLAGSLVTWTRGEFSGSTTTSDDGCWEASGLRPGTWYISVVPPDGYTATTTREQEFTVTSGSTVTRFDVGAVNAGGISGTKYHDLNGNGQADAGEPGLEGWEITLSTGATTTTDANGFYSFIDVPPGTYTVTETQQAGWKASTAGGESREVVLGSAEIVQDVDFFNHQTSTVSGRKWRDNNFNGQRDIGEVYLAGWTMVATWGEDQSRTTTTNAEGRYTLENLVAGIEHTICEQQQEDWTQSFPADACHTLTPGAGESLDNLDFGNVPPVSITGRKWADANGNGEKDGDEVFVEGWNILLTWNGGETTTVTDAEGVYRFDGLLVGRVYQVCEEQREGWTQTFPTTDSGCHTVSQTGASPTLFRDFGNQQDPVVLLDFGDALEDENPEHPEVPWGYPVTLANNGARHVINGAVRLGTNIDPEGDGQSSTWADADDSDGTDDEDGVIFGPGFLSLMLPLEGNPAERTYVPGAIPASVAQLIVYPSTIGRLDAWLDTNSDGDWDDDGEWFVQGVEVHPEVDTLTVDIPSIGFVAGFKKLRVRYSLSGTDGPDGLAPNGEVEDYLIYQPPATTLSSTSDTGDSNPGDGICDDGSGACSLRAAIEEGNASGYPQVLVDASVGKQGTTLTPLSPYPPIETPILLSGAESQTVIDGSLAGANATGLHFRSDGSKVFRVTVQNFQGDGMVVEGSNNTFEDVQVSNNGGRGYVVLSGQMNRQLNGIFDGNAGLAIDLGGDGVTENDSGDSDSGPNGLLNYPVITLATSENGRIEGSLSSHPGSLFHVYLYANEACHESGHGGGSRLLLLTSVETDASGTGTFGVNVDPSSAGFNIGESLTALTMSPDGNVSEFSVCFTAVTTDIEEVIGEELPTGYRLFQNYPNPFNPTTTFQFAVPERAFVVLDVFDVQGRHVDRVANGWFDSGTFRVDFDAGDLPSGTYLYRMVAGSHIETRSFTLLK